MKIFLVLLITGISNLFTFAKSDFEFFDFKKNSSETCPLLSPVEEFISYVIFCNSNSQYPEELWTERNKFEDWKALDFYDIAKEINSIYPIAKSYIKNLDFKELSLVLNRVEQMQDIATRALLMKSKNWRAQYADVFNRHIIGIRKKGISDLFPEKLVHSTPDCDDRVYAERDYCRTLLDMPADASLNRQDVMKVIEDQITAYIIEQGGNYEWIKEFKNDQGKSSWSRNSCLVKKYFMNQRNFDHKAYYGPDVSEKEELQKDIETTIPIWHAYTQEFLRSTNFLHNENEKNQICLTRFQDLNVFLNSQRVGDVQYRVNRAAYDSFTLFNYYYTNIRWGYTSIISMQLVDHIQVFDCYLLGGYGQAGEKETEFIVLAGPESDTYIGDATPFIPRSFPGEHIKDVSSKMLSENWCSPAHAISLEEAAKRYTAPFFYSKRMKAKLKFEIAENPMRYFPIINKLKEEITDFKNELPNFVRWRSIIYDIIDELKEVLPNSTTWQSMVHEDPTMSYEIIIQKLKENEEYDIVEALEKEFIEYKLVMEY